MILPALELRAGVELRATGRRLVGYAAIFGTPARIGHFFETIIRGAFTASLADPASDVLALVDHAPGAVLGRTRSGTLRLAEDTRGLHFEIDTPDTALGRDILTLAVRGDLGGMSFGFKAKDETWPAPDRRELRAVELHEISVICAFPAYSNTTVDVRSRTTGVHARRARLLELSRWAG